MTTKSKGQPDSEDDSRHEDDIVPTQEKDPPTIDGTAAPVDGLFDLEQLRLPQNFADAIGVKKVLLTVPVRKPDRQWWVRVHPDEAYRMSALILDLKDERTTYIVNPALSSLVVDEVASMELFTAINRQGVVFLWPVRLPAPDGRRDEWNRSALVAADLAMRRWARVVSKFSMGAYEVFTTESALDEPEWPDVTFRELVSTAFKGRYIDTPDHEVLQRLRGLA
jgi:hypothetical protein